MEEEFGNRVASNSCGKRGRKRNKSKQIESEKSSRCMSKARNSKMEKKLSREQ